MYLTSQAAKNMAYIILAETQGIDRLRRQEPLNLLDQGDRWLIYGTPYEDNEVALNYCQFYIIFKKETAEIVGLGSEASMKISETAKQGALKYMTEEQFEEAFGPRRLDNLDGSNLATNLDFNEFLYGGLVNTSQGAVGYACNLMQSSSPAHASISAEALSAEEKSGTWYISKKVEHGELPEQVLSFSRLTGRVLSGNL